MSANAGGYPRLRYYVADASEKTIGFILWSEKSGFRNEVVPELEQIAVLSSYRCRGVGRALIQESLKLLEAELYKRPARIMAVLVTTRTDNEAQRLCRSVLGAEPVAVIKDLYSADEVIMVARPPFHSDGVSI